MEYTIRNQEMTVVVKSLGAELQSIRGKDGPEYLWQGDPAFWGDRAPNIFPYVARLTEGTYTLSGQEYAMRIHGFVKYMELEAKEQREDAVTFELRSCEDTRKQYPFDFAYRITYRLRGKTLAVEHQVENLGSGRMYFGIGGHPGFQVPLEKGLSFENYQLSFTEACRPYRVGFTEDCFLNGQDEEYPLKEGRILPLEHSLFDQDAVVLKHACREVTLSSDKGSRGLTVTYPDFPYIGFWHKPNSQAPYVCVEPWSSLPSRKGIRENLSQQSDLIALEGGKCWETVWEIRIF